MYTIEAQGISTTGKRDTFAIEENLTFKKAIQRAKGWLDRGASRVSIINEETGDVSGLRKENGNYTAFHLIHGINRGFSSPFELTEEENSVFILGGRTRDPQLVESEVFERAMSKLREHNVSVENQVRRIASGLSALGSPTEASTLFNEEGNLLI